MKFDCTIAFEKGLCKHDCCGCVPIHKDIAKLNEHKQQREVKEVIKFGETDIVPLTVDGMCVFLNDKLGCMIYEDRPSVCRDFGCNPKGHILLQCPYLTTKGVLRSNFDIDRMKRTAQLFIKNNFKN